MSSKPSITAADIRAAMLKHWAAPEYAIMWEVANGTGYATGRRRWADAVIMSIWPSRGLELHGVEIKVSRGDWKREAIDPSKAEAVAEYCDRWWLHTPPGIVDDISELPPNWGWRTFDGAKWKTQREAARNEAVKPMDRVMLAALLRRNDGGERARVAELAEQASQAARDRVEEEVKRRVDERMRHAEEAVKVLAAFEEGSGLKLSGWTTDGDAHTIGALVKTITQSGVLTYWDGVPRLRRTLSEMVERLDLAMTASNLPFTEIIRRQEEAVNTAGRRR